MKLDVKNKNLLNLLRDVNILSLHRDKLAAESYDADEVFVTNNEEEWKRIISYIEENVEKFEGHTLEWNGHMGFIAECWGTIGDVSVTINAIGSVHDLLVSGECAFERRIYLETTDENSELVIIIYSPKGE